MALISIILSGKQFSPALLPKGLGAAAEVSPAKISTVLMATFNSFKDAIEICIFILILGGFLNIINQTGALEAGIKKIVKNLNENELIIIPILMILFSIVGSTFGMDEETIPFYAILTPVMVMAGFDPIVSIGVVLLGSGSGVFSSNNRYITEVVPYLLVPCYELAKAKGIEVPIIESCIHIASAYNGENYFEVGRTLKDMGIE